MNSKKLEFSTDVLHSVQDICKLVFNLKSNVDVEKVFGISNQQLQSLIEQISDALPQNIFDQTAYKLEEIKNIFAREFIFFQVQEKYDDPHYQEDLLRFIHIFSRDIQQRMMARSYTYKIKEDH